MESAGCLIDMSEVTRTELQFLPAALEVLQTPSPGASRVLGWAVISLVAVAIIWATVGWVDTVMVVSGELSPTDAVNPCNQQSAV